MHEYVPYVACEDARAAIRWYCTVFAATCIEFIADGSVNVAHAELLSGEARFFVSSVYPEQQLHAAQHIADHIQCCGGRLRGYHRDSRTSPGVRRYPAETGRGRPQRQVP